MIHVKWLGIAGLEFNFDGYTYLIDPYLTRSCKKEVFFKRPKANVQLIDTYVNNLSGKLSGIIVGHSHFDHAMDIPELSKRYECPVIGNNSLDALLEIYGQKNRVTITEGNEKIELKGGANVTMIPSRHGLVLFGKVPYHGEINRNLQAPLKASDYKNGQTFIPKLEIDGKVFMHSGIANFDESQIEGHKADVLFVCLPGWKKIPEYTNGYLESVDPDVVIPFHFDDFSAPIHPNGTPRLLPFQDMKGFLKNIRQTLPNAEIRIPEFFKTMTF